MTLLINGVSRKFNLDKGRSVQALKGVDLAVPAGEFICLLGGSGCGKSTLLRLIAGLDQPTTGDLTLDGQAITAPRDEVGIVFQEPRLLPWRRVTDNVGFGLRGVERATRAARIQDILDEVGLGDKGKYWPRQLSGGQAQRAAIARALVQAPELLLLDEPFSAVDALTRADLHDLLLNLWREHEFTTIMVTHDIDEALALADRIVVMGANPGRIVGEVMVSQKRPRNPSTPGQQQLRRTVLDMLAQGKARQNPDDTNSGENDAVRRVA
ncbi:MAG: ABC transporter ATP-binding protein [Pseudomonadota bacterium]